MKRTDSGAQGATGFLLVILVFSILGTLGTLLHTQKESVHSREYIQQSNALRVLSQQLPKHALEAVSGKQEAFVQLDMAYREFQQRYYVIHQGDMDLPPVATQNKIIQDSFERLSHTWNMVRSNIRTILDQRPTVMAVQQLSSDFTGILPQLRAKSEEIMQIMVRINPSAQLLNAAGRYQLCVERLQNYLSVVLDGGPDAIEASEAFLEAVQYFEQMNRALLVGDAKMGIGPVSNPSIKVLLQEMAVAFEPIVESADIVSNAANELVLLRDAANEIFLKSGKLLAEGTALSDSFQSMIHHNGILPINQNTVILLGVMSLMTLALISHRVAMEARQRLQLTATRTRANQTAINLLLNELHHLAEGDLRVMTTVNQEFTGAIAESVNNAIEQLRTLVATINHTSVAVDDAAEESLLTARKLTTASEYQRREITAASTTIEEMARSIDSVSVSASEAASVGQQALDMANRGQAVVQATVAGMETIRRQIRDSSKRVKRLGESSQEIGNIVSLIDDIAERTNILALNAAIQASMAGTAGRGFAVVADEVQRLAERSSEATKQIEILVKAIQTDTSEAVISMEETTNQVVKGTALAHQAGNVLAEFSMISQGLSEAISDISQGTQVQSTSAGEAASTMNVIREIATQSTLGANASAASTAKLAELAREMRKSAFGFKLPEAEASDIKNIA